LGHVQVGVGAAGPVQGVGLVGQTDVEGVGVRVRVHGDRGELGVGAGADDADGDLPAVGDQDLLQGRVPSGVAGAGAGAAASGLSGSASRVSASRVSGSTTR